MSDAQREKEGRRPVDVHEVLSKLASLPITTWNYKTDDPSIRHIGPMAQDFAAAFKVGDSDKHIHLNDAVGVAFAAIQALNEIVESRIEEVAALQQELATIRAELRAVTS